jgi:hypothetical protein
MTYDVVIDDELEKVLIVVIGNEVHDLFKLITFQDRYNLGPRY